MFGTRALAIRKGRAQSSVGRALTYNMGVRLTRVFRATYADSWSFLHNFGHTPHARRGLEQLSLGVVAVIVVVVVVVVAIVVVVGVVVVILIAVLAVEEKEVVVVVVVEAAAAVKVIV